MSKVANKALAFPNNKRSGARKNSIVFMVAIRKTCVNAHHRDLKLLITQTAIRISETPIILVRTGACCSPSILATIASCRGT